MILRRKKIPAISHLGHVLLPCTLEFSYEHETSGGQFILKWIKKNFFLTNFAVKQWDATINFKILLKCNIHTKYFTSCNHPEQWFFSLNKSQGKNKEKKKFNDARKNHNN